ncbi:MAG: hypothetical protein LC650_01925 [Actinobacteria bacterium]|nr:hypothetical protein [Actinomycetota bacterium]
MTETIYNKRIQEAVDAGCTFKDDNAMLHYLRVKKNAELTAIVVSILLLMLIGGLGYAAGYTDAVSALSVVACS